MNTQNDNRTTVLMFFNRFIEDFLVGDLQRLKAIEPDPKTGLYACTIPTAMSVIAGIDLLGFLIDKNGKPDQSRNNIRFLLVVFQG